MGNSKGKVVEGKKPSGKKFVKLSALRPRNNTVKLEYNGICPEEKTELKAIFEYCSDRIIYRYDVWRRGFD